MKRQQVAVAGDDQIRTAIRGQFQEFVVFRIAARDDALLDLDFFRSRQ
jgi:hypothetical protein